MEIGMVGLGRMGGGMAERLIRGGHRVVGYAPDDEAVTRLVVQGGAGATSLGDLAARLTPPRVVWMMVPVRAVDETIEGLLPHLAPGDVLVDGGNSFYRDSMRRAEALARRGVHFLDVGTSGGLAGRELGYCLMIGGAADVVARLAPVFQTLAPQPDRGWARVGPPGAGHFVKMVHNGIEYGLMQAYAEGFALMARKTEFALDLAQVAELWRHGSVVRSWLLDLAARALAANPTLAGIAPYVEDSGAGRWTVIEAVELACDIPVITLALQRRFRSRDPAPFGDRLLAALRQQFGGHPVRPG
ncbi:MAG: decarboxylating 6-phosphogluconate dehydrogenase [Armatimonadota bacterium]|nr:decarboxylating 6-phosphogluconate dehydrogenase [Armatimonadota bacterium]